MNASVTRRALLGATATVGAIALPALAEVRIPSADSFNPDAELLRLLDSYPATLAAMLATGDRSEALWEAYSALEPERPEALHHCPDDSFGIDCAAYCLSDGRHVRVYEAYDVEKLRERPQPTRIEETSEPFLGRPGDVIVRTKRLPDERRIARRAEILAAHDAWSADCQVIKDRLGIPAADDADDEATSALWALESAILAKVPTTFAGLAAKARWVIESRHKGLSSSGWHKQIVEDVLTVAEHGGVASRTARLRSWRLRSGGTGEAARLEGNRDAAPFTFL